MNLWDVFQIGKEKLSKAQAAETCAFDCYCLMEYVFGYNKNQLLLHRDQEAAPNLTERFLDLIQRRCEGYPLQYLLGSWEFWGLPFVVGEGVLIPRADTETLAETCLTLARQFPAPVMADLCSGSGCLPVVFSKDLPQAREIYAVELSDKALPYLEQNVKNNGCSNITVLHQDALTWTPPQPLHLISSNPPYLSAEEMVQLQKEVTFEPEMALEAPENGLFFYRVLSHRCYNLLVPGGFLAFEVGYTQASAVRRLMEQAGFCNITVVPDLCGIDRVVWGQRPNL